MVDYDQKKMFPWVIYYIKKLSSNNVGIHNWTLGVFSLYEYY